MSRQSINEYRADLDRLRAVSGSRREGVLSDAFKDLLRRWGKSHDLTFVSQHDLITAQKTRIYLDGALLHALRVPFGYWEAKDEDDDLDVEIAAKFRKGYPRDNIIFSDDRTAILIQDGAERARVAMDDTDALHDLLTHFFAHERREIADFNKAVRQFGQDLPAVLAALRDLIAEKRAASSAFAKAEADFLKHAQDAINPAVSQDDVQEMLIQHILTEDIFAKVFDNPDFHRQNNVASELYKLEEKLFDYGEKQKLLRALQPYYAGISAAAAVIQSHSEKQGFLKGLYENFYKVYNAKAADRLGVVYTPGEIVRFMIRSADWLCEKHFGKNLIDRGVEILDPATGTGTFIVELLEHFRGHRDKLRHKYKEELHANEVAILPYYVANLNIEATYQAITGGYEEVAPWPVERVETSSPERGGGPPPQAVVEGARLSATPPGREAGPLHHAASRRGPPPRAGEDWKAPKPVLKSHPDKGLVVVDADTQITGIPQAAWDYRLGNRSAIDWVLDQHKEKKPRDPTIAARFNTYRFADYKESMIALLAKVVRVSVETVRITDEMRALVREEPDRAAAS